MKHSLLTATALAALALSGAAQAAISGFQGPLAEANFSTSNTGNLNGAGAAPGTAVFTTTTLTLSGGDTAELFPAVGCAGAVAGDVNSPCRIQTVVQASGTYSFNYNWLSNDGGGPAYDLFGVLLDGVLVGITDPGGTWPTQSGSASFSVTQSFGFFLSCTDCTGGNATTTIDNLTFVPEPGSLALVLGALGIVGGLRRRQRG